MNIAFFDTQFAELDKIELQHLRKSLNGHDVQFFNHPLHKADLSKLKNLQVLCVFVSSNVTCDILEKLPSLKLIVAMSVGVDHIDTEHCTKHNIAVCNVPAYGP